MMKIRTLKMLLALSIVISILCLACNNTQHVPKGKESFIGTWQSQSGFRIEIKSAGTADVYEQNLPLNNDNSKLIIGITPKYAKDMQVEFYGDTVLIIKKPTVRARQYRIDRNPYLEGGTMKMVLNGVGLIKQEPDLSALENPFLQGQATLTESPKAGPEYNILDAWVGIWNVQGEAKDSISGPQYHVDWTLNGKRILNGFAIEIAHEWKTKSFTQNGIEITGYDPIQNSCITNIFYNDGSWISSTPVFINKSTCIENGATYYPSGKVDIWRNTWNFSQDLKQLDVKSENQKDSTYWISFVGKGIKK